MPHYQERLERDLQEIRAQLGDLHARIDTALRQATEAMLSGDDDLATRTIIEDNPINRATRELERICHSFIVRHLPSAGVLRFVSSVMRLTVALERIGDYACSISREALLLSKQPPKTVAADISLMLEHSRENLRQATAAFIAGDAERAESARQAAFASRRQFGKLYADLLRVGAKQSRPPQDLFAFLITFYRLERVTDQARNICEETLFTVAGQAKPPRQRHILFIDEKDCCLAPFAAALARKAYPDSGRYTSAGWTPALAIDATALSFMNSLGLDPGSHQPTQLATDHDALAAHDLIISLSGNARERLTELPFRTLLLQWDLEAASEEAPLDRERLAGLHRELARRLHELMDILVGERAG